MDVASTSGRKSAALSEQLFAQAYRFEFFQAVRLLEKSARSASQQTTGGGPPAVLPVGRDSPPAQEVVRFRALPSLTFPAGDISHLRPPTGDSGDTAEMTVAFMGLTGPSGVLPQHYTSLVIERSHVKNKDYTLRDFFDVFNHRVISLFFRAWEKYRFPFAYERARLAGEPDDLFTFCLYALVGLATPGLRNRLAVDDEAVLYYGGHFAHFPRSAAALESLVADYFGIAASVEQFQGQWLYLSPPDQSRLPGAACPGGLNVSLGRDVIVGSRVWDVQGKFRLRLGPLNYGQFAEFMPSGQALPKLADLVRLYAGPEFDFDVQPVLEAAEVPWCRLEAAAQARLGWNTWIRNGDFAREVDDAVFQV